MSAVPSTAGAATTPDAPYRVLIIDDSAVARAIMARAITASGRGMVAQAVATVRAALTFLAADRIDFILLDINLPEVDGLTALPDLLAAAPGAKVVVVSSAGDGIQALALGAAEVIAKPGPTDYTSRFSATLADTLERLNASSAIPVVARPFIPSLARAVDPVVAGPAPAAAATG